jgi:hypothetical protein
VAMRTNERKWPRRRQRPFLSSPSRIGARFCLGRQLPLYLRTGFFFIKVRLAGLEQNPRARQGWRIGCWVGAESAGTTRLAYRVGALLSTVGKWTGPLLTFVAALSRFDRRGESEKEVAA